MKNKGQTTFISVLLLSIVLGVVLYMYYVSPTKQKTASLQASNATLTERVNTLEAFHREMPDKRKNIESMTAKINEDLASLPADVKEEDMIYLALHTMDLTDLRQKYADDVIPYAEQLPYLTLEDYDCMVSYKSISVGEREDLASIDGEIVKQAGIEGLEDTLYFITRRAVYDHITDYNNMKCLIQSINSETDRKTLTNISYSVGEDGILEGVVSVDFYSVHGTNKEYVPKEFGEYETGLSNIFIKKSAEK